MSARFDRYKHHNRQVEFQTHSSVEASVWYKTIEDYQCHRAFIMEYKIKTLFKQQQDLINVLTKPNKFLIVEEYQLTRPCRVAAMVMQVCVNVAAMKKVIPPVGVDEDEFESGVLCRPYVLMIFPDQDIDPSIPMDVATLSHWTHVEFSTPDISVDFPGDEAFRMLNTEVIFSSMKKLKKFVGQKAIDLSRVQRIIIDEPLHFDKPGFESFAMLLRHPELNPNVDLAIVGHSFTEFTDENIKEVTDNNLPSMRPHTVESRKASKAEWDAYGKSL
ncbi:hypothetical protein D6C87_05686 [Aureobasidium pullulans]|uniref:Uncharacterized protein n=1 Tax=Aureobasidium pullulans TaxID=5580 RepID=A0AB38LMN8_AURPU|nr:hypothetical protein D6D25_02883 [Aureobasidium pullulans]THY70429.1 hypothetical protein D6C94_08597 [Aureobasidium pullulans]THZ41499.1 hypothetical protein D6C87_05686 [Aureobasidium pullulans]